MREWEKLWRKRWDINDYVDLDQVFAGTEDLQDLICEVELIIQAQEGRTETCKISLFDSEGDGEILASYDYTMLELWPRCECPLVANLARRASEIQFY